MTAASQPCYCRLDRTSSLTPTRARAMPSLQPRFRLSSPSIPRRTRTRTRTESSGWTSRRGLAGTREAATTTTAGNASRRGTTAVATRTVRTTVRGRFHGAQARATTRQADRYVSLAITVRKRRRSISPGGRGGPPRRGRGGHAPPDDYYDRPPPPLHEGKPQSLSRLAFHKD